MRSLQKQYLYVVGDGTFDVPILTQNIYGFPRCAWNDKTIYTDMSLLRRCADCGNPFLKNIDKLQLKCYTDTN